MDSEDQIKKNWAALENPKFDANITLDFSQSNAKTAGEDLIKSNPKKYVVLYIDPKDEQFTFSSDGFTITEQIGMLEMAKYILLHKHV